jgi:cytochrome c-type biogenesis protein CcmE
MKVVIPFLLILVGLVGLIAMGVTQGGIPELQVSELQAGEFDGKTVKVHGFLESIESATRPLRFTVRDKVDPEIVIAVTCNKTKPDTFQKEYDVAVEGIWDATTKSFEAEHIYTKCPSKYEAEAKEGMGSAPSGMGYDSGSKSEPAPESSPETVSAD